MNKIRILFLIILVSFFIGCSSVEEIQPKVTKENSALSFKDIRGNTIDGVNYQFSVTSLDDKDLYLKSIGPLSGLYKVEREKPGILFPGFGFRKSDTEYIEKMVREGHKNPFQTLNISYIPVKNSDVLTTEGASIGEIPLNKELGIRIKVNKIHHDVMYSFWVNFDIINTTYTGIFEKNGYFPTIIKNSTNQNIILVKKTDYFSPAFLSNKEYRELREELIFSLDKILKKGFFHFYNLEFSSIKLEEFRNKKYLNFDFKRSYNVSNLASMEETSSNILFSNSTKETSVITKTDTNNLSSNNIAAYCFKEAGRLILNEAKTFLTSRDVEGISFNFKVSYSDSTFNINQNNQSDLDIKMYFDENEIKKYKDYEITGQEFLNNSVIIINGDRSEVNLSAI